MLNEVLLPAMKEVGDKFGAGELILPFVLQSAEVDEAGRGPARDVSRASRRASPKGTVVLATVYGDVHDIGKNLVNTILTNNGYTVHDLGKQVPVNRIIDKAVEVDADRDRALGAAGIDQQADAALRAGAASARAELPGDDRRRGDQPRRTRSAHRSWTRTTPYEPGVFYAKDAFEGLSLMDRLIDPESPRRIWCVTTTEAARQALGRPGRSRFQRSRRRSSTR